MALYKATVRYMVSASMSGFVLINLKKNSTRVRYCYLNI